MPTKETLPPEGFIDVNTAARTFSVSRSTIYNWVARGLLPHPARIGPRRVGFDVRDVRSAIDSMRQGTFSGTQVTTGPRLQYLPATDSEWVGFPADLAANFADLISKATISEPAARDFLQQARATVDSATGGLHAR